VRIPTYSNRQIDKIADEFLDNYHPDRTVPVPIDEIVEFDLDLEIVPIPQIENLLGVVGYLSTDLQTITVDPIHMEKVTTRYRFTLAHEVAHILLHGEYIRAFAPATIDQWKRLMRETDPEVSTKVEKNTDRLANAILVPCGALETAWDNARARALANGLDPDEFDDILLERLARPIADTFHVNTTSIIFALRRCGILGY